jgi:nucleophosmin 1
VLSLEKNETQPLDLYLNISQSITISCVGKNEIHLSGYFEPNNSLEDEMYGDEEEDDDDEELSDDEKLEKPDKSKKQLKEAQKDVVGF